MVPQHTVSSNLNTPVSANPRQSFDSYLGRLLLHHTPLSMVCDAKEDMEYAKEDVLNSYQKTA